MTEKRKQIGWLIISEGEKGTLHYETASWYKELLLDVGKHPLFATFEEGRSDAKDTSIHAPVEGTIISDAFPSSFGGHIFSSNLNEHIGERDTWHYTPYAHALAKGILEGNVKNVELLDNFRAVEKPFVYQGRPPPLSLMLLRFFLYFIVVPLVDCLLCYGFYKLVIFLIK